jgi:hypothetical protein
MEEKTKRGDAKQTTGDVDFSLLAISPSPDDFFSLAINMAEATKQFKQSGDEATTTEIILSGTRAIFIGYR